MGQWVKGKYYINKWEKILHLRKRQKWLEKLSQTNTKNLGNIILGHATSYYKGEFSPNMLRIGKNIHT